MNQLLSKKMKATKNNKGFTLIELIVVIAILGILAAIAVPRLTGFQENARLKAHMANIRTIEGAVSMYEADKGSITGATTATLTGAYVSVWPTEPGTYDVVAGVLTASPTKAATQTAIDGGAAVTWP